MSSNHVHQLIDHLGERFFLETLGWTERNLRHAKSVGKISALWFDAIDKACLAKGFQCPRAAFNMKEPAKDIGEWAKNQGAA